MKCFKNATVYVDGKGLVKCAVEFDEKIQKISKKSKAEEIALPEDAIVLPGFIDNEAGSIKVGKRADFTVINENYDVLLTVRGGEIVYQA